MKAAVEAQGADASSALESAVAAKEAELASVLATKEEEHAAAMAAKDEEMKANVTFFGRRFLTRGMIGCFLSHRACWQHAPHGVQDDLSRLEVALAEGAQGVTVVPRVRQAVLQNRQQREVSALHGQVPQR